MNKFKHYKYLTIFLVIISSIGQNELDPSKIKKFKTVYTDIKIPEIAKVGEVLSFDPSNTIKVIRARNPYDPNVFGVVVLDSFGQKRIAIGGEVDVLIDKSLLFFEAGVWLVTSGSTGRAMPLEEGFPLKAVVIGITLESWSSDKNDSIYTVKTFLTPGERITPKKHLPSRDE